jgi:hypothetical protein
VIEVVDGPRRQQLSQGHLTQRGMQSSAIEVAFGDEVRQPREVLGPEASEVLNELVEGRIGVAVGVREAVELRERDRRTALQDALRAIDPVGQLAGDEVPHHVVRTPAVGGHIGRIGP